MECTACKRKRRKEGIKHKRKAYIRMRVEEERRELGNKGLD